MPKGYWIGHVDVHNLEGYQPYTVKNPEIFAKFGGKFIVRGSRRAKKSPSKFSIRGSDVRSPKTCATSRSLCFRRNSTRIGNTRRR